MMLPGLLQRLADRFNAETDMGLVRGWHAAHGPASGQGPGTRRQAAERWLDAAGQRLDELLARDRARRAPAGGLRRLGQKALAPARGYIATTLAFGYATAETVGWYDGHRARAAAAAGPRPLPPFTGPADGNANGYAVGGSGQRAANAARHTAGRSRRAAASGSGRAATTPSISQPGQLAGDASASPASVSRLSFATSAQAASRSRLPDEAAISLPAAPARRAIGSRRAR